MLDVKNKKIVIVLVAVILIILLLGSFVGFKYWRQVNNLTSNKTGGQDMAKSLKDANADILNNINNTAPVKVRDIDSSDHIKGDIGSPVEIIFYGDFDCQFCSDYYKTLKKVEENYKDKVVMAFRHYPLRTHDFALIAALASECAAEQNKFWEMYEKLYTDKIESKMNLEQFYSDAKSVGLKENDFKKCMEEEKYKEKIQSNWDEGRTVNIIGTPGSFINSEQISGAIPWDDFKDQNGESQEGIKSIIERHLQK